MVGDSARRSRFYGEDAGYRWSGGDGGAEKDRNSSNCVIVGGKWANEIKFRS